MRRWHVAPVPIDQKIESAESESLAESPRDRRRGLAQRWNLSPSPEAIEPVAEQRIELLVARTFALMWRG